VAIIDVLFFLYLLIAAFTDLKFGKVYNFLTIPAIILGIGLNFFYSGPAGLKVSVIGFLVGFFILFIFFMGGGVGPGDVKFLAGAGALMGWQLALLGTLYGAIIAGMYSLIYIIWKKKFKDTCLRIGIFFRTVFYFREFPTTDMIGKGTSVPYVFFLSLGLALRWLEVGTFLRY